MTALSPARNEISAPPAVRPSATPALRTLLIVDDEEGPRQALQVVFEEEYRVLLASNGAAAVELARQNRVDAAVLDIRMAGLTGIDVLALLKKADPAVEVVMLTAYETLATAQQALRLGACDYLTKPFAIPAIRAAVATAMERRSVSDSICANNRKLVELNEEIKQCHLQHEILRTRGQIYASILHDLNSPLSIIAGYVSLIAMEIAQASRLEGAGLQAVKKHLTDVSQQVKLCSDISRRYLRFLRDSPAENAWAAVNATLKLAAQLLHIHPSGRGHQVLTHPLLAETWAKINGTELVQILVNLGVNALQCSPQPHRVQIAARTIYQDLPSSEFVDGAEDLFLNREGFQNTAPLVALSVSDNGPGISPELLPRVFEPYFTTKSAGQGSGLGLAIVLRLLKAARGALHLRSRPGQGATFTVYLQATQPDGPGTSA